MGLDLLLARDGQIGSLPSGRNSASKSSVSELAESWSCNAQQSYNKL